MSVMTLTTKTMRSHPVGVCGVVRVTAWAMRFVSFVFACVAALRN